jgi:tRNA (uracil-5-)-methyltransferase
MECKYFGKCGSCNNFKGGYQAQLNRKVEREQQRFTGIFNDDFGILTSSEEHFRGRAEFKVWHENGKISLAMRQLDGKEFLQIDSCSMVVENISELFTPLLNEIEKNEILKEKLFSLEFLSSTTGDLIVTLIYHKKLQNDWEKVAKELQNKLNISIIGRSRKQKIVLGKDFVSEKLNIGNQTFVFHHLENSFSQPNPIVNEKMVSWVHKNLEKTETDLLELYCGSGNFTIPLASKFRKVLATEVSKSGITTATENRNRNKINNIQFGRVSSEEFVQAIDEVRKFNRLKHIDLKSFNFSTVFVDPPRAGIDKETLKLLSRFENIIYISCNPETLKRDIEILSNHSVQKMAIFDQFPYTNHLEMGVILKKQNV